MRTRYGTAAGYCLVGINIEKYLIPIDGLDLTKILSTWVWLAGDKSIVALTKSGDILLRDTFNNLYFLDTGGGTIEKKAENYHDFFDMKLSYDLIEELLLPNLVDTLEKHGLNLKSGQVYSYIKLPILGGTYDEKNMVAINLYEHYNLTGEIQFKLKDTPDGTQVDIAVK